jgi:hypothetical protein
MGCLDGIFGLIAMTDNRPPPRDLTPNVANRIAAHLSAKWPELVGVHGLWFSGSQVWSHLYGKEPPATSDTDVFVLADAPPVQVSTMLGVTTRSPLAQMVAQLGLSEADAKPRAVPAEKPHYEPDGMDIEHPRGSFDIWTTKAPTVQGALHMYPRSHSHCRAAFSFTEGLVVLPNEEAK